MKLSRYYASLIATLMLISPIAACSARISPRVDDPEGTIVQISADVYFQEGVKKARRGDYQGAIEDFTQALRLNPQDAIAFNNRGLAYANQGDYQPAIADYNQALRLNPQDAEAYYNRGLAYRKLGDTQQAITDLRKAADLFRQQKATQTRK